MNQSPIIFDKKRVRLHRARALRMGGDDFLLQEMAQRALERLEEVNKNFSTAIELGTHTGALAKKLKVSQKVATLIQADMCEEMARAAGGCVMVADEEFLPIAPASIDLCISLGSLHWVNDLPGALVQINKALKPGGLFLAMLPGGQTLHELRDAFEKAEMEITGGVSARISPFVDARDAAGLLQRAGFSDPVADTETLTLEYDHPLKLLKELRAMGQASALIHSQKNFTRCDVMMLMTDIYLRQHMNDAGRIPATMELVTLTAWKPDA